MSTIDNETFKRLSLQNWKHIYPNLILYAEFISKKYYWKSSKTDLPKGYEPKDLARDAIQAIYEGRRKWDYITKPDLLKHLKSIVDSNASHLLDTAEHRRRVYHLEHEDESGVEPLDNIKSSFDNPLEELIAKDIIEHISKYAVEKNDEEVQLVLLAIEAGCKGCEISEQTGLPIKDVNNALKRLKLIYSKI